MILTDYVFAFYVLLLICAGVWFFSKITRNKKREDKSSYEKEQRLFQLYQNVEDMMTSFEEYVEEAKNELNQTIAEASLLLGKANNINSSIKMDVKNSEEVENLPQNPTQTRASSVNKNPNAISKEMILDLKDEGMDEDEIAKELGISRREVSLFIEMKKIKNKIK